MRNFISIGYPSVKSSHRRGVIEKVFLKISQNSQENTRVRVCFLIKLQAKGKRPATLLIKRPWHRCLPVNSVGILRTLFLQNSSGGCFRQCIDNGKDKDWKKIEVIDFVTAKEFLIYYSHFFSKEPIWLKFIDWIPLTPELRVIGSCKE